MMKCSLAFSLSAILSMASPAWAADAFRDVPVGHWAYQAVEAVAIKRDFMKPYADGLFHGEDPFTRAQLSVALAELIELLEKQTKTSWATEGLGGYEFTDLRAGDPLHPVVMKLANQYRLFEGVPGLTSKTFEGDKQITRYEMARVVDRLLRLGEEKGVVNPSLVSPRTFVFTDVAESARVEYAIKNVAERYQVMVGFPDGSFRGNERLTRFEFAASAAQTFPLVQELVRRTQASNETESAKARAWRYGEEKPLFVEGGLRLGSNQLPFGGVRGVAYRDNVFFVAEGQFNLPANDRPLHTAGLDIGYAWPLGASSYLQPFVGARGVGDGSQILGGVSYGLVLYHRPAQWWGAFGNFKGSTLWPAGMTGSTAQLAQLGVGLEWHPSTKVGLQLEGGVRSLPFNLNANAPAMPFPYIGVGAQLKAW